MNGHYEKLMKRMWAITGMFSVPQHRKVELSWKWLEVMKRKRIANKVNCGCRKCKRKRK